MKMTTQFAVGACGGALAAFLWIVSNSARTTLSSDDSAIDPAGSVVGGARLPTSTQSISPRTVDTADAVSREALATGLAATREWAFVDPTGFFAYAETADSIDDLIDGLEILIATDPERVWRIAARFDNGPQTPAIDALYLHAIRGMTGRDPAGTIASLVPGASGPQRDSILASIAEAYAEIDPGSALTWAMSVDPASTDALGKVIEIVATEDLPQAYAMLRQAQSIGVTVGRNGSAMAQAALRSGQDAGALAAVFAARNEPEAQTMLTRLVQQWARQNPEDAVTWMAANEAHLNDELTSAVVSNLAFDDVALAAELAARVPPSAQAEWLDAVAFRYGQFNLDEAMRWLSGFEGRAGYDAILKRTLNGGLLSDAEYVANYIETSGVDFDRDMIRSAASALAGQDPEAAVQWAMRLPDSANSIFAVEAAVDRWGQADAAAAARWAVGQPRNSSRDRILDAILLGSIIHGGVDPASFMDAYSSSATAQRTVSEYIFRASRLPPSLSADGLARAEPLLELLTDPAMRAQAEEQIAAAR